MTRSVSAFRNSWDLQRLGGTSMLASSDPPTSWWRISPSDKLSSCAIAPCQAWPPSVVRFNLPTEAGNGLRLRIGGKHILDTLIFQLQPTDLVRVRAKSTDYY
jgi:hypothetical protein